MTLKQVLQFVEANEAGKRSATQLIFQQGTKISHTDAAGCSAPSHVRQKHCPAFNHNCSNCHKPHHMESVCRREKNAAFDTICTLKMPLNSVQNHTYDVAVSKRKERPPHV